MRADATSKVVCLQPLGPHDRGLLSVARRGIRALYRFEVRTLRPRPLPRAAYYAPRDRYRAQALIDHLVADVIEGTGCDLILGFTRRDISTPHRGREDWGIFGLATLGGPAGVVSTHRLHRNADHRSVAQRTVKVTNHELGHALGMPHVNGTGCLMQDAMGKIATVDRETGLLSERTRLRIEALHRIALPRLTRLDWAEILGVE